MAYSIRTILYATDLGSHERETFCHAAGLAQQFGARIYIVHALEPIGEFAHSLLDNYLSAEAQANLHQEGFAKVREQLQARLSSFCADELQAKAEEAAFEIRLIEGRPAQVILDEAKRIGADLIVLGSHGKSALDEMLMGSVAHKVTMKSSVPVLLVPIQE
jgi:nucleotide-binding universal stress UspA family protein